MASWTEQELRRVEAALLTHDDEYEGTSFYTDEQHALTMGALDKTRAELAALTERNGK